MKIGRYVQKRKDISKYLQDSNLFVMLNMKYSLVELNELPDEILVKILKNLINVQVLYSFMRSNQRFDRLVRDDIFTNRLSLLRSSSSNRIYSLDESMVNRFCDEILPEIHHQIQWLDLEAKSTKQILLTARYPKLRGLSLYNVNVDSFAQLIQGNRFIYAMKFVHYRKIMTFLLFRYSCFQ